MGYWDSFALNTREWIIVLHAVIIVLLIISMIALIICIVRNCCFVIFSDDEQISCINNGRNGTDELTRNAKKCFTPNTVVERDVIITVPQQATITGQPTQSKKSDIRRIDENCPVHGRKKYQNSSERQSLLIEDEHMTAVNQ